jgi:hypothetical protein
MDDYNKWKCVKSNSENKWLKIVGQLWTESD